ncbi:hypothetical protein CBR_g48854 [Chara braunii]|uniref:CCHC-type domain-containing protein n=1 Tax=Chara braunii TaxID=69332 RepID=A0A388M3I4_CHABU|nr:hypothetical protein CBR_g48854 [Chara braunii]|eukprot:GBG89147.1 hypothetical protein CBR_g48854 [Chara braunii]
MSTSGRREEERDSYDRRRDDERGSRERRTYRPVVCFNCNEEGHYANQCPQRGGRASRPLTSTDSRRSRSPRHAEFGRRLPPQGESELRAKVAELSKGIATIKEHFDEVRAKKEEKARKKWEKEQQKEEAKRKEEEEERLRAEEAVKREAKKKKRDEKARKEAIARAEMKKEVTLHAAKMICEIKDDFLQEWKTAILPGTIGGVKDMKGKKAVEFVTNDDEGSDYNSEGSETSVTQELSVKTGRLCLAEKRKREEDVKMEDSPPMELPAKRTPRRPSLKLVPSLGLTRSKSKAKVPRMVIPAKTRTPVKTPLSKLSKPKKTPPTGRLTPASKALARLRFRDAVIKEIKDCNADELQRMCREEGIHYDGKLDAIFGLAEHRAQWHFGREGEVEVVRPIELGSDSVEAEGSAGMDFPRVNEHVKFRLSEVADLHPLLSNANNVPKIEAPNRLELLRMEQREGFLNWKNLGGEIPDCDGVDLSACLTSGDEPLSCLSLKDVTELKERLKGLVISPVDRNPGETVVMCPITYYDAMMSTFICNPGYRLVDSSEGEILREIREDTLRRGIIRSVSWDATGSFGAAYVIPKQKDLGRYRPICPSFNETMVKTARTMSKALNHLLSRLPRRWHFNLRAVSDLSTQLDKINERLDRLPGDRQISSYSFDIKEMFSKLPHESILNAVDWIIDHHRVKGHEFVRVNTRGKGATFGLTTGDDHWKKLDLETVKQFVHLEIEHTYFFATGVLLRQVVGVPMGKSMSPPIACFMFTFSEYQMTCTLGRSCRMFGALRLIDDVLLIVSSQDETTRLWIVRALASCYPDGLVLKRTDNGSGTAEFLGCEIRTQQLYPFIGCVQLSRNENCIWNQEKLTIQNGQSFHSWGSKKQKSATIGSHLHRIQQNTSIRSEIPGRVLGLQQALVREDFPLRFVNRVFQRFGSQRDELWRRTIDFVCDE